MSKQVRINKNTNYANTVIQNSDFIIVNNKIQLTDDYYIRRGKSIPTKK